MRDLNLEELELIVGTGDTTGIVSIPVTGHAPTPPSPPPITIPPWGPPPAVPEPPPPPPPEQCETAQAAQDRVDQNKIKTDEGYTNHGVQPTSKSGLTIGNGIDLQSKDATWLANANISAASQKVLAPFAGAAPADVPGLLSKYGSPVVPDADLALMYNKAYSEIYQHVTATYNAASTASGFGIPFTQLPAAAQTAIMDLGYQTPNLAKYPNFWSDITSGQWDAAINELQNWSGPGNTSPRKSELADLLQQAVNAGLLPGAASGKCN